MKPSEVLRRAKERLGWTPEDYAKAQAYPDAPIIEAILIWRAAGYDLDRAIALAEQEESG